MSGSGKAAGPHAIQAPLHKPLGTRKHHWGPKNKRGENATDLLTFGTAYVLDFRQKKKMWSDRRQLGDQQGRKH